METGSLEALARQAVDGDRAALEELARAMQGDVYGLARRMLWNREDAEDATQEILVRAITRLAQFDFRSRLKTWVYRIAVNYLLDVKKSPIERQRLTFEQFSEDLSHGLSLDGPTDAERSVLTEEVKIGCTLAMLQCLDRPHRLAYVLGELLDVSGPDAAEALDISPDLFRKRLQHARAAIESFTRTYCGLASDTAACACHRRVPVALRLGRVQAGTADFAEQASSYQEIRSLVRRVERARRAVEVHRSSQPRLRRSTSPVALSSRSTHRTGLRDSLLTVDESLDLVQSLAKTLTFRFSRWRSRGSLAARCGLTVGTIARPIRRL